VRRILLSLALAVVVVGIVDAQFKIRLRRSTVATTVTYGPKSTVTCPGGATNITTATSAGIQAAIGAGSNGDAFCLNQASYTMTSSITPKTGQTFTCVYGTVLDATTGTYTDNQGVFGSLSMGDVDNVEIRNCELLGDASAEKGIIYWNDGDILTTAGDPDDWQILDNYVHGFGDVGVVFSHGAIVRRNKICDNTRGGYSIYAPLTDVNMDDNEICNNGTDGSGVDKFQGYTDTAAAHVRRNYIHHNDGYGYWCDGNCIGSVIEDNTIEYNGISGLHLEISLLGTVNDNIIRFNSAHGILCSTCGTTDFFNNTLEGNGQAGFLLQINCVSTVQGWDWNPDLIENDIHDNTFINNGLWEAGFTYTATCPDGGDHDDNPGTPLIQFPNWVADYQNNAKNNEFYDNTYYMTDITAFKWLWPGNQNWAGWQSRPHSTDSTSTRIDN